MQLAIVQKYPAPSPPVFRDGTSVVISRAFYCDHLTVYTILYILVEQHQQYIVPTPTIYSQETIVFRKNVAEYTVPSSPTLLSKILKGN